MKYLMIMGSIILGFNILRFIFGAITTVFSKKAREHHKMATWFVIENAVETIIIVIVYIVLVTNYFKL